eukprot:ctg_2869.g535
MPRRGTRPPGIGLRTLSPPAARASSRATAASISSCSPWARAWRSPPRPADAALWTCAPTALVEEDAFGTTVLHPGCLPRMRPVRDRNGHVARGLLNCASCHPPGHIGWRDPSDGASDVVPPSEGTLMLRDENAGYCMASLSIRRLLRGQPPPEAFYAVAVTFEPNAHDRLDWLVPVLGARLLIYQLGDPGRKAWASWSWMEREASSW